MDYVGSRADFYCHLDDVLINTYVFMQLKLDLPSWRPQDDLFKYNLGSPTFEFDTALKVVSYNTKYYVVL